MISEVLEPWPVLTSIVPWAKWSFWMIHLWWIPWWPGMLYGRLRCLPDWNHQGLWHVSLSGGRSRELGEAVGYFWRIYSQILYLKTLYYIGMTTSLPKWFLSFRKNNLLLLNKFTLSELNPISKTVPDRTFNIFQLFREAEDFPHPAGYEENAHQSWW